MTTARHIARSGAVSGLILIASCTGEITGESGPVVKVESVRYLDPVGTPVEGDLGQAAIAFVRATEQMLTSDQTDWTLRATEVGQDGLNHVRLQQTYGGVKVWEGDVVVHASDKESQAVNGTFVRDLDGVATAPVLSADEALAVAKSDYAGAVPDASAPLAYERESSELVILPRGDDSARLVWHTVFYTELQGDMTPGLWNHFVDAETGEILHQYDAMAWLSQASGPGGNAKVSRTWTGQLDVEPSGTAYAMNTARLRTTNLNHATSGAGTVVTGPLANISDAAIDDAHGFAELTLNMLQDWMGYNSIDGQGFVIKSRVHYGTNFENAGWDGTQMTYGDGASTFYALSGDIDVVAHEINHGFTTFHSNLTYSGQSGGNNESFSDIAGTIAEFYAEGNGAGWDIGTDIFKGNSALRFMCNPTQDGASIDNAANYSNGIDVHYSSGVMNKAFCRAARRLGSGSPTGTATADSVKRAGTAWYLANASYWTAGTTFVQACQGVLDAAGALNFSAAERDAIRQSWADVGVACDGGTTQPACDETLTGASGTIQSPNFPSAYGNNYSHTWCIQPAGGAATTLTFSAFDTEAGYDFVKITNGVTNAVLANASGATAPAPATATKLIVQFTSDQSVTGTGWRASWGGAPLNQVPSVSITAPAAGSTVSGAVTVSATAADLDGTVARVELTLPDGTTVNDTSAPYTTSWNSSTVANGSYTVRARAFDNLGAASTEASVAVTVSNTTGCIDGTFASADVPRSIPDNNATGITSTLAVTGNGTIASLALSLSISHTWRGDLRVRLIAPNGAQYIAHNLSGGSADNLVLDNVAVTAFNGAAAAGTWRLRIQDLAAQDLGTLTSWSLNVVGACQ